MTVGESGQVTAPDSTEINDIVDVINVSIKSEEAYQQC